MIILSQHLVPRDSESPAVSPKFRIFFLGGGTEKNFSALMRHPVPPKNLYQVSANAQVPHWRSECSLCRFLGLLNKKISPAISAAWPVSQRNAHGHIPIKIWKLSALCRLIGCRNAGHSKRQYIDGLLCPLQFTHYLFPYKKDQKV